MIGGVSFRRGCQNKVARDGGRCRPHEKSLCHDDKCIDGRDNSKQWPWDHDCFVKQNHGLSSLIVVCPTWYGKLESIFVGWLHTHLCHCPGKRTNHDENTWRSTFLTFKSTTVHEAVSIWRCLFWRWRTGWVVGLRRSSSGPARLRESR